MPSLVLRVRCDSSGQRESHAHGTTPCAWPRSTGPMHAAVYCASGHPEQERDADDWHTLSHRGASSLIEIAPLQIRLIVHGGLDAVGAVDAGPVGACLGQAQEFMHRATVDVSCAGKLSPWMKYMAPLMYSVVRCCIHAVCLSQVSCAWQPFS